MKNPDIRFGDGEMVGQYPDERLVGLAVARRRMNRDHEFSISDFGDALFFRLSFNRHG